MEIKLFQKREKIKRLVLFLVPLFVYEECKVDRKGLELFVRKLNLCLLYYNVTKNK